MPSNSSPWRLPLLVGAGVAALAAGLGGAIMVGGLDRAPEPPVGGPAVQIALFQPNEPEIVAGSVMDVGPLIDGYQHRVAPAVPAQVETARVEDEPEEVDRPSREVDRPYEIAPVVMPDAASDIPPDRRRDLAFFDSPRPDYAEARRQRREMMERRMADRADRAQVRVYRYGPPPADYRPNDGFY